MFGKFALVAACGCVILSGAASAHATVVAGWDWHSTGETSYPLAASNQDAAVASTSMTYVGVTPTTYSDYRTVFTGWDPRAEIDLATQYLEFSIAMQPGQQFDPTALRLTSASQTDLKLDVRSSQDSYASSLGVLSLTEEYVNYRVDLSSLAPTDSLTLRLYGLNSTTAQYEGFFGVTPWFYPNYDPSEQTSTNFLAVSGAVPEPTVIGGLLSASFGLMIRRRQKKA